MKSNKKTLKFYELKKIQTDFPKIKIKSSSDCYELVHKFYHDDIEVYESVYALMLNANNEAMGFAKISQGGIISTFIDVHLVLKYAVDSLASSIILVHNHPSGNLQASESDIAITKKTKNALNLFDVKLLDHLILTKDSYYSFADNGLI